MQFKLQGLWNRLVAGGPHLNKSPAAGCRAKEFPVFLLVVCKPLLKAQVGTAGGKRETEVEAGAVVPIGFPADSQ